VSTGNMVHKAFEVKKKLDSDLGIIDLYKLKPIDEKNLCKSLAKYDKIISLEEHLLDGGLGSILAETIMDNDVDVKLKRIGLTDYIYAYGGRENVREESGIGINQIIDEVANFL